MKSGEVPWKPATTIANNIRKKLFIDSMKNCLPPADSDCKLSTFCPDENTDIVEFRTHINVIDTDGMEWEFVSTQTVTLRTILTIERNPYHGEDQGN